jgi:hypothetical protein
MFPDTQQVIEDHHEQQGCQLTPPKGGVSYGGFSIRDGRFAGFQGMLLL